MPKKSKIVRIELGRTINTGNYESTRVSLHADLPANAPSSWWKVALSELEKELLVIEKRLKKHGTIS